MESSKPKDSCILRRPTGSLSQAAQFPHTVFYDLLFECPRLSLWVSPVYFGELISPQSLDSRSAATAEVVRKHATSRLTLKYLCFFSVVIVCILTGMAHCCDLFPNERPDELLSALTRLGEAKRGIPQNIDIPSFSFFFTSAKIKDTSVCFGIDPILFLSFFEAFSLSLSTEFCNNIVFKPLGSKNVFFFSLLYKLLISSTLSPPYFIIQADRLMAASAATLI